MPGLVAAMAGEEPESRDVEGFIEAPSRPFRPNLSQGEYTGWR